MKNFTSALALVVVLALTGCTAAPSAAPSASPSRTSDSGELGEVKDINELVRAYEEAGGDCPAWERTDQVTAAIASGQCSDADVFMVFDEQRVRDNTASTILSMALEGETKTILVGPNWIINSDDVFSVVGELGGELRSGEIPNAPEPEPTPDVARQEFSGNGDMVQDIGELTELAVVTFSCPQCTRNTVVKSDGQEGLLVNEIGAYSGSHLINVYDDSMTTRFEIEAKGSWTLTVDDITSLPSFDGEASGKGDTAFLMMGSFTAAQIKNTGESNFTVHAYGTDASPLIVNEIGSYSGVKAMSGPALVQVGSSGTWSITPQ